MKFSYIVFVCFVVSCLARNYNHLKYMDWAGGDIRQATFESVEQMESVCDATENCIGFNTHGWMKKEGGHMTSEGSVDLYLVDTVPLPSGNEPDLLIWPRPNDYTSGDKTITIDIEHLKFSINEDRDDAINAFDRFKSFVRNHASNPLSEYNISKLDVVIDDYECPMVEDMDESYTLTIPDDSDVISITSPCLYGYYHALHTLSQLIQFVPSNHGYIIKSAPWAIKDEPFFKFRGLMIDSSRHFLPVRAIKSVIDSMSLFKFNVLHWHISDEQSFPLEIPNVDMAPSSFSIYERYTIEEASELVDYARQRGIRIMAEIDVPGHAAIWCASDPSICPSETCLTPLNPAREHTFEFIENIIKSLSEVFPDAYFHVGGDEVNTDCWKNVPEVADWMKANNYTVNQAYSYFVNRVYTLVKKYERTPVFWEEVFNSFKVPTDSIIEIWLGGQYKMQHVVEQGFKGIFSNYYEWYLPQLAKTWDVLYNAELMRNITDPELQKRVLGGEICMWGEKSDISNFEQTIWPRGVAAAERLWTKPELLDVKLAQDRIAYQRCYLNWKGIIASPTFGPGRSSPVGPNGCLMQ